MTAARGYDATMADKSPDPRAASLAALDAARRTREAAEARELDAVAEARRAGASWSRIGELYGLTKQGAQQRFKKASAPGVRE